ncbi:hypothetical protein ONZ45_g5346 [Pleurotus djamor]|nr:hypothetical protein ONZ45_g5346 [Pleurotus djamor]
MISINIGDIVATIGLAYHIIRVLSNSRRAPVEHQALSQELIYFGAILDRTKRVADTLPKRFSPATDLQPSISSASLVIPDCLDTVHISDLCCSVDESIARCHTLLEAFNARVQSYDVYLSGNASANPIVATWKRICWAALMKKHVTKLKTKLSHERESMTLILSSIMLLTSDHMAEMMAQQLSIAKQTRLSIHQLHLLLDNPSECVWLIDVASKRIRLPFSLCSTWKSFELVLKSYLRGQDFTQCLNHDDLEFMKEDSDEIISPETWDSTIKPNSTISMSVIIRNNGQMYYQKCPSCDRHCATSPGVPDGKIVCSCGTIIRVSEQLGADGSDLDQGATPQLRREAFQRNLKQLRRFRVINMLPKKVSRKRSVVHAFKSYLPSHQNIAGWLALKSGIGEEIGSTVILPS